MTRTALALLLALAALFAVSACGGDDDSSDERTTGASDAGPTSGSDVTRSSNFQPPVAMIPARGYVALPRGDVSHSFYLERTEAALPDGYLVFLRPTEVFDPVAGPTEVPGDLTEWLAGNPTLEVVDGPVDITVGGLPAQRLDVRGRETDNVFLFAGIAEGEEPVRFFLAAAEPARIVVVNVDGQQVVIAGGPFNPGEFGDDVFDVIREDVDAMVESIEFE